MGYVVGGALCTGPVAWAQQRFGRKTSFMLGLAVALGSALLCAFAAYIQSFWLLCAATTIAGYYRSEEHTSELQSLMRISYAVFCLKKKTQKINIRPTQHSSVSL